MNNLEFIETIKESFLKCLQTSERSTAKLKILHGAIATDVYNRLNLIENNYTVASQGVGDGKEKKILGRYINKAVDITILDKNTNKALAGIGVKFVMSNYSQNSNNYFENMIGETANIRSAKIPYFQVFIIPDILPYYEKDGTLSHWEELSEHYLSKYIKLSEDNIENFMHTPNKTLFFMIHIDRNIADLPKTKEEFKNYYLTNNFSINLSSLNFNFGNSIIYNDYENFIKKVVHSILSL